MKAPSAALFLPFVFLLGAVAPAEAERIAWPDGAKAAVSLSYDDALDSQLDNAVPALNKYDLKASFYPLLASPVIYERLDEWRALAVRGHELGNHTLYHPCSAAQPGNDWVRPHNDLDKRTVEHMQQEVFTANSFLKALDGRTERTMTPPCGHAMTSDGDYVQAVKGSFVAIKGIDEGLPSGLAVYAVPSDVDGAALIRIVEQAARVGGVANIIFHGIGGDHLAVSVEAHEQLLRHLARNRATYWTDTYLNIMKYVRDTAASPSNP